MDFLSRKNVCGQTILRIVSQGNAILAELTRLSSMIPVQLTQDRYSDILLDFSYLRNIDAIEQKIENDSRLRDMDERFKENHLGSLSKFYLVFECVHRYTVDLNTFLSDLDEGSFIQQSLESVLDNPHGKQLLAEALYLCGIMLLYIDQKFEGIIRERILILYYRYSGQRRSSVSNVDDVCKLFRSTGYVPRKARPNTYPDEYFKRANIDGDFVSMLLGRLRSDDIYNQIALYPLPEHRSVALANQAAILYITLYFSPKTLQRETSVMREIVDKYFSDNWVIATYMGNTVNLVDAWEPYKAARLALQNVQDTKIIQDRCEAMHKKYEKLSPQLENFLKAGALTESMILEKSQKFIAFIRDCNVTLRWWMLHACVDETSRKAKQLRDIVVVKYSLAKTFEFLVNVAEFEQMFKDMLQDILNNKQAKWESNKRECIERMTELAEVYSGTKPLARVEKIAKLQEWFEKVADQVANLELDDPLAASRKLLTLIDAVNKIQNYHQIESHIQVKQYVIESRQFLHNMLLLLSIKDELMSQLEVIGDISYGWLSIEGYTRQMQQSIQDNPGMVVKLRTTFLKLASALDLPLLRMNQANSKDMEGVSAFYSNELINYIRSVLHIIPQSMFHLLARIIDLQTNQIKQLPTRLMKDQLKDFAQMDERMEVAKLTRDISVFTDGVLAMKTTLVGIVEIDPRKLLEDGIRKELVNQLSLALHNGLIFNQRAKNETLLEKLCKMTTVVDGYHRSFEYVQDYIGIRGLQMFQQEFSRIINFNVEQECNAYLRQQIQDYESEYQSKDIPIPKYAPTDASSNFVGRLANELARVTDPKTTVYVDHACAWYNKQPPHNRVWILADFTQVLKSVGTVGLVGLDRLYAFQIAKLLRQVVSDTRKLTEEQQWLSSAQPIVEGLRTQSPTFCKVIQPMVSSVTKQPNLGSTLQTIGHLIVLRRYLALELRKSSTLNAKNIASSVKNLNDAVMLHMPETTTRKDAEFFGRLSQQLRFCGLQEPAEQIYNDHQTLVFLPMYLALLTVGFMPRFSYSPGVCGLLAKNKQPFDCVPFAYGLFVLLRQFHTEYTVEYVRILCSFIMSSIDQSAGIGAKVDSDVCGLLVFLDFASVELKCIDRRMLLSFLPEFILSHYKDVLLTELGSKRA